MGAALGINVARTQLAPLVQKAAQEAGKTACTFHCSKKSFDLRVEALPLVYVQHIAKLTSMHGYTPAAKKLGLRAITSGSLTKKLLWDHVRKFGSLTFTGGHVSFEEFLRPLKGDDQLRFSQFARKL